MKIQLTSKRVMNARKFLLPMQLFKKVQWWSNPRTQLLHTLQ